MNKKLIENYPSQYNQFLFFEKCQLELFPEFDNQKYKEKQALCNLKEYIKNENKKLKKVKA